jgi:hypothetical protein
VQTNSFAIEKIVTNVAERFFKQLTSPWLLVSASNQMLYVIRSESIECAYMVSTSKYGLGGQQDSYKTPLGAHVVAQKIGGQCQTNEILRARKATGECAEIISQAITSHQDLVLTRLLWLKGLESNINLGEGVDSFDRYIYIHGTQEEGLIGTPASHGCVRMTNKDVIELYNAVEVNTFVYISE